MYPNHANNSQEIVIKYNPLIGNILYSWHFQEHAELSRESQKTTIVADLFWKTQGTFTTVKTFFWWQWVLATTNLSMAESLYSWTMLYNASNNVSESPVFHQAASYKSHFYDLLVVLSICSFSENYQISKTTVRRFTGARFREVILYLETIYLLVLIIS